jgi:hypothetical protein
MPGEAPMTAEKWAALEAGWAILFKAQEDLDRVPEETTVDWSACGAAATLVFERQWDADIAKERVLSIGSRLLADKERNKQ